jgi:hypothetical protein
MARAQHKSTRGRRTVKTQQNFSLLSFTANCGPGSLLKAIAKDCDAHNEN